MMDLDPVLRRWQGTAPWNNPLPEWTRRGAASSLTHLGRAHNLTLTAYEPPEEEWICVGGTDATAVTSALFPLAFVTAGLRDALLACVPHLTVVPLASTVSTDYRASPSVLRATLLRFGWTKDFSPAGFCVSDLLVESIPSI